MRIFQGKILDSWSLRRGKAARYPVDVGERIGLGVGRGVCAVEGFPPQDDHEGQQHGVEDRNPSEDEPRDVGVLPPLLMRPVPVNEIDTQPGSKQRSSYRRTRPAWSTAQKKAADGQVWTVCPNALSIRDVPAPTLSVSGFVRCPAAGADQLSPQVLVCSATVPLQPGFGFGTRVVFAGQGFRISGARGGWLKLKSWSRLPRMEAFSRTLGRGSGRPSVAGLSRAPPRKSSSMNFR